jgi:16S rRNA (guanine527-N7)-methyltransferase
MMEKLAQEFQKLSGISLSQSQLSVFSRYAEELKIWNTKYSLTAIRNPEEVRIKHFLDSLSAYLALRGTTITRIIDIGTGAGFPGLPLKILCPGMRMTLVESVGKKASFCEHAAQELNLDNIVVLQARAEAIGQMLGHREKYDWALARAVAIMPVLAEYLLPLVQVGGKVLAMKGEDAPAEVQSASHAIQILGGHLQRLIPVTLPGVAEIRHLVVIDKVSATPGKYPRREGIPSKRPLSP